MQHRAKAALSGAKGICLCRSAGRSVAVADSSWMVNVVATPEAPGTTVGGLKVAVAPGGRPLADIVTMLLNEPFRGGTVTMTCTEPPSAAVTGAAGAVTAYAGLIVSVDAAEVEP